MATSNGLDIHHEIQGEGPPIVFVHGLGATSNVWHAQRMTLSKYYKVIVYDRSGSGRSPKARDGYSIDAWTDELAGLLDHLVIPVRRMNHERTHCFRPQLRIVAPDNCRVSRGQCRRRACVMRGIKKPSVSQAGR